MIIEILGIDPYRVAEISQSLQPHLLKLEGIREEHLLFLSAEATLYHKGVDQNTWIALVRLRLESHLKHHVETLMNLIKKALLEDTIHIQFDIQLIDPNLSHFALNPDYPIFVTEANEVELSSPQEETDIFLGNAFEKHEKVLEKKAQDADPLQALKDEEPKH